MELRIYCTNPSKWAWTLRWCNFSLHPQSWFTLRWRHNGRDGVSNHQPHDCLLNRLFSCKLNKTSKLRVTGLCVGTSPVTCEFPAQRASNAENVTIWWRHHESEYGRCLPLCKYFHVRIMGTVTFIWYIEHVWLKITINTWPMLHEIITQFRIYTFRTK